MNNGRGSLRRPDSRMSPMSTMSGSAGVLRRPPPQRFLGPDVRNRVGWQGLRPWRFMPIKEKSSETSSKHEVVRMCNYPNTWHWLDDAPMWAARGARI